MIQDSSSAWRYNLLHNQYKGIPVTSADHPLHQQWVQLYSEYMQLRQMLEQQGLQPNTTYYAPASYQQPPQYYQPPVVPSQLPPAGSQSAPSYQYAPQAYYPPQNNWTGSMLAPHDPYASPTIYDLPKQYGDTQVPPWLSQQTRQPDSFESRAPSLQTGLGSSYRSRNWSLSQPLPNYSQPSYQGSSSYVPNEPVITQACELPVITCNSKCRVIRKRPRRRIGLRLNDKQLVFTQVQPTWIINPRHHTHRITAKVINSLVTVVNCHQLVPMCHR